MSEAETPGGAPKPTSQLAADRLGYHRSALVKALNDSRPSPNWDWEILNTWDALVARVTDLEAQLAKAEGWKARAEELEADYRERAVAAEAQVEDWAQRFAALSVEHTQALRDADAAEAQVAALTQERDEWRDRAGRGHATALDMLATTRQALTEIMDVRWLEGRGEPRVAESVRSQIRAIARRALAETEESA